jgi:hypothetical protein
MRIRRNMAATTIHTIQPRHLPGGLLVVKGRAGGVGDLGGVSLCWVVVRFLKFVDISFLAVMSAPLSAIRFMWTEARSYNIATWYDMARLQTLITDH